MGYRLLLIIAGITVIYVVTCYHSKEELLIGVLGVIYLLLTIIINILIDIKENGKKDKD